MVFVSSEIRCWSVLELSVQQYRQQSWSAVPSEQTEARALCFTLLSQSFGQILDCQSIKKNHQFCLFSDSSSESEACESTALQLACHLGVFNRSGGSKCSASPYD